MIGLGVVVDTNVVLLDMAHSGLKRDAPGLKSSPVLVHKVIVDGGLRLGISREVLREYKALLDKKGVGGAYVTLVVRRLSELRTKGQLVRSNPRVVDDKPIDIKEKDRHLVTCVKGIRGSVIVTLDGSHLLNPDKTEHLRNEHSIDVMRPEDFVRKYQNRPK